MRITRRHVTIPETVPTVWRRLWERRVVLTKNKSVMVTTRRSNLVQNETQEEARRPNLGQDDIRGEAESVGPEARITQLSQTVGSGAEECRGLAGSECFADSCSDSTTIESRCG
jgi:hypothetical protein